MARIQTYQNDSVVTVDDKVIGTDAVDNSTKNFTVGDILALGSAATTYTAGTGINIANGVISSTVVDTDTTYTAGTGIDITGTVISSTVAGTMPPEKLIAKNLNTFMLDPTPRPIDFSSLGVNASTNSIKVHDQNRFTLGVASVENSSGQDMNVKITMHSFTNALQNNRKLKYNLEVSPDNSNWTVVKSVERDKAEIGEHASMFGSWFLFNAGQFFRITVESGTGNIELLEWTQVEFEASI